MRRYDDKVVLITGAARGQGRAHAVEFAREGANVAICDLDRRPPTVPYPTGTREELEETAGLVRAEGGEALTGTVDVREFAQVASFTDAAIERFGKVDVCIANAGVVSFAPSAVELTEDQWRELLDINLTGVWHTFKAVIPHMRERGYGRLIASSSAAAFKVFAGAAHYVAAKNGVIGLVKTLAAENAEYGITANVICPGNVDTPMIQNDAMYGLVDPENPTREGLREAFAGLAAQPGGWMDSEEISYTMLHVGSDRAARMTGAVLMVDMGMTIR